MKRFNQIMVVVGCIIVASFLGTFYGAQWKPGPSVLAAEDPEEHHWCSPSEVQGIDAYWKGEQQKDNPYSARYDIVKHIEWYRGWVDAKEHGIR